MTSAEINSIDTESMITNRKTKQKSDKETYKLT
jgi:hypothetical protein